MVGRQQRLGEYLPPHPLYQARLFGLPLLLAAFSALIMLSAFCSPSQAISSDHEQSAPSVAIQRSNVANPCCRSTLTVFGGATFANSGFYAQQSQSQLLLFGIRYDRLLLQNRLFAIDYSPEIIPAAFFLQSTPRAVLTSLNASIPRPEDRFAYGLGASPIGIKLVFTRIARLHPFVGVNGGLLYFDHNVPSSLAAQFNFSAAGEAGLSIPLDRHRAVEFSYRFHHFSNAFEAADNPGVDSQMLYLGYTFPAWGSCRP